jgi:hypothetical protein
METGNHQQVAVILRDFKTDFGAPNFPVLYNIPNDQRIRDLAKIDFTRINLLIIGALTIAFEGMNLKRGMNEMQILTLSELIIESSSEDNLALEDFMLFLQNMLMGKYQLSFESMDIPKFMQTFEIYRQERWRQWVDFKENEHLQYKTLGAIERTGSDKTAWQEHLSAFTSKLQAKNDEIKELRAERKRKHEQDNF